MHNPRRRPRLRRGQGFGALIDPLSAVGKFLGDRGVDKAVGVKILDQSAGLCYGAAMDRS